MEIINHYSMIISAVFILGLTAYFLLRNGYTPRDGVILIGVAAALLGGWLILRPQQGSAEGLAQLQAEFGQGRAVLLEMQSPF
ncbi:MAG: hypothetical protein H8E28_08335 [Anaerolineae bacterium]|nr:hypothetical protein [Anaerolineae bacterium]